MAGGLGFALACDMCVAAEDAKLGMPEVKRDLMPMNIMAPLSRVMPPRTLFEMVFSGENVNGRKAYELGMVNACAPAEELDTVTMELAKKVSIGVKNNSATMARNKPPSTSNAAALPT